MAYLLGGSSDYADQLRDQVWPYALLWEDKARQVQAYLIEVWKDNNPHQYVATTLENVKREKNLVLEWWWRVKYGRTEPLDTTSRAFGQYLLGEYRDAQGLTKPDKRGKGPRQLY